LNSKGSKGKKKSSEGKKEQQMEQVKEKEGVSQN